MMNFTQICNYGLLIFAFMKLTFNFSHQINLKNCLKKHFKGKKKFQMFTSSCCYISFQVETVASFQK